MVDMRVRIGSVTLERHERLTPLPGMTSLTARRGPPTMAVPCAARVSATPLGGGQAPGAEPSTRMRFAGSPRTSSTRSIEPGVWSGRGTNQIRPSGDE